MSISFTFGTLALTTLIFLTLLTQSSSSTQYATSCVGLSDGYYNLKLIDSDDYPIITQQCSNEYTILNYDLDNNLKDYFTTWDNWHMEMSGPSNDEHVNWRTWYLPDNSLSSHEYLISPDCNSCDVDANNQLYDTLTAYYMTGTIYGCFWFIKGQHNCDMNYDTLNCYTCAGGIRGQDSTEITIDSTIEDYETTGICGTNIRSADFEVNTIHYDCTSSQGLQKNLKPSLGNKGRFCVCAKPTDAESQTEINLEALIEISKNNEINKNENNGYYELYQSDFDKGTYRITQSGTYVIMEDIEFDFNAGDTNDAQADGAWWPTSDDSDDYPGAGSFKNAYFMGFFSGITVEIDDVIIDLNGHSISQSELFYYQQRWFVGIEIGTQYFLPGQGLGNFGANPVFPKNVVIKNGIVGLSSHHGIHGNNNENVLLQDLVVRDFETHGIQFNGFDTIALDNVEVGPSSSKVFFSGEYAHMRALLPRLRLIAAESEGESIQFYGRDSSQTMSEIVEEIEMKMNMVWNYVVNNIEYDDNNEDWIDAKALFYNEGGLLYGGAMYGIFLNTYGASVFTYNLYCKEYSQNAKLTNVKIHDISHEMKEYIAVIDSTTQIDLYINPLTAPFSYDQLFNTDDLSYKGSIITDAYLAMEYFSTNWYYLAAQVVGTNKLLNWALTNDLDSLGLYLFKDNNDDKTYNDIFISCNYDVMIHSGKGINGLRLDGVQNVEIDGVEIYNLHDYTPLGRTECGYYSSSIGGMTREQNGVYGRMHFRQTAPMQVGFSGNMVQAMQINAVQNVKFSNINIHDLKSSFGQVYGMAVWPENDITFGGDISIYNLEAGSDLTDDVLAEHSYITQVNSWPNGLPEACGIRIISQWSPSTSDEIYTTSLTIADDIGSVQTYNVHGRVGCGGISYLTSTYGDATPLNEEGLDNMDNYDKYWRMWEINAHTFFTTDPDIAELDALYTSESEEAVTISKKNLITSKISGSSKHHKHKTGLLRGTGGGDVNLVEKEALVLEDKIKKTKSRTYGAIILFIGAFIGIIAASIKTYLDNKPTIKSVNYQYTKLNLKQSSTYGTI